MGLEFRTNLFLRFYAAFYCLLVIFNLKEVCIYVYEVAGKKDVAAHRRHATGNRKCDFFVLSGYSDTFVSFILVVGTRTFIDI